MLADGRSARAAGCGAAFLDGGCGYDLGKVPKPSICCVTRFLCTALESRKGVKLWKTSLMLYDSRTVFVFVLHA